MIVLLGCGSRMPAEWNINYARWIIDDGEPEREVAECFRWFAVEFWASNRLAESATRSRSASERADYAYHVVAEVVHVSEEAAVIDFGLRAVGRTELLPMNCRSGDYVSGDIGLGFPLCTAVLPEGIIVSLNHGWLVKDILADLTPYRPGDETG